jgi:hypothetical protein
MACLLGATCPIANATSQTDARNSSLSAVVARFNTLLHDDPRSQQASGVPGDRRWAQIGHIDNRARDNDVGVLNESRQIIASNAQLGNGGSTREEQRTQVWRRLSGISFPPRVNTNQSYGASEDS